MGRQIEIRWEEDVVEEIVTGKHPLPETEEIVLDPEQMDALYLLCYARIGIITGGPGTGKTRTLRSAIPFIGKSLALCAPSGKAARRMAELTGCEASTVHRLLGLKPDKERGAFHRGNPLPYDVVVVDEASTLDTGLAAKLLDACDVSRTRVVFVGDVDQLPSVGPGQVLHDLIESGLLPVVRLKTVHRSAQESWVYRNAPEILDGAIDLEPRPDFRLVEADDNLVERTVEVVRQLIGKYGRDAVQTIVPMNVGDYGAAELNRSLQKVINPQDGASYGAGKARAFAGDDVVVISNDYDKAVFNGETGRVEVVEWDRNGKVIINFDGRRVVYTKSEAGEFTRLSYALTVHKMQGSEISWVVLAMHESHGPMLSRKLLYTAVTRAKDGVMIVGQASAVRRCLHLEDTTRRYTLLKKRLARTRS